MFHDHQVAILYMVLEEIPNSADLEEVD